MWTTNAVRFAAMAGGDPAMAPATPTANPGLTIMPVHEAAVTKDRVLSLINRADDRDGLMPGCWVKRRANSIQPRINIPASDQTSARQLRASRQYFHRRVRAQRRARECHLYQNATPTAGREMLP